MYMLKTFCAVNMSEHLRGIEPDDPGENLSYDLDIRLFPDSEASACPYEGEPDIGILPCIVFGDPGLFAARTEYHPQISDPPHPLVAVCKTLYADEPRPADLQEKIPFGDTQPVSRAVICDHPLIRKVLIDFKTTCFRVLFAVVIIRNQTFSTLAAKPPIVFFGMINKMSVQETTSFP
jgi:hypothetical protein